MSSRKAASEMWWAGYCACMATIILAGEAKAILTGNPACGDASCHHQWYTIPAALLLLCYAAGKSKRAEKQIEATTFEMVEPEGRRKA